MQEDEEEKILHRNPPIGDIRSITQGKPMSTALHVSEEQFRMLVESVTEYAIFLLDTEGYIVSWNPGAERIKGYKAEEIIGQHFSKFYTEKDLEVDHPRAELQIALVTGRFEEEGWRVRKDGTLFRANVVISPLFDKHGIHRGFSKVTRDITERKKAEESRLAQVREQVSRSFLKDILFSVTEGRLRFCENKNDLPERLGECSLVLPFTKESLAPIRALVREVARSVLFPEDRIADLLTGVGEATMNAVVHAQIARCQVCTTSTGAIQVWIEDKGPGIKIGHLHRATLERGFTTRGTLGHGFWLMLHTCDRVWLLTSSEGTSIVLEQERVPTQTALVEGW